jgi:hypothetical protein
MRPGNTPTIVMAPVTVRDTDSRQCPEAEQHNIRPTHGDAAAVHRNAHTHTHTALPNINNTCCATWSNRLSAFSPSTEHSTFPLVTAHFAYYYSHMDLFSSIIYHRGGGWVFSIVHQIGNGESERVSDTAYVLFHLAHARSQKQDKCVPRDSLAHRMIKLTVTPRKFM